MKKDQRLRSLAELDKPDVSDIVLAGTSVSNEDAIYVMRSLKLASSS